MGQGAHTKHQFQAGAAVCGEALPVPDPRLEAVEFYKVGKLKVGQPEAEKEEASPPPWRGVPPPLAVYRERSSAARRANLSGEVLELHLGMPDAGRDDH